MKLTSRDIIEILKTARELGYREFHLEHDGLRLTASSTASVSEPTSSTGVISRNAGPATRDTPGPQTTAREPVSSVPPREGLLPITAPMSGIFYRSSSPGAPPFVNVGSTVKANDVVCIIEVMKLFSSIRAPRDGIVEHIVVENEASVLAGQPVMWLRPEKS
jgi:acetyl-CoA carboxylase biotin carboxyl carrier protein